MSRAHALAVTLLLISAIAAGLPNPRRRRARSHRAARYARLRAAAADLDRAMDDTG